MDNGPSIRFLRLHDLFFTSQSLLNVLGQVFQIREFLFLNLGVLGRLLDSLDCINVDHPGLLLQGCLIFGSDIVAHCNLLERFHNIAILHEELNQEGFLCWAEGLDIAVGERLHSPVNVVLKFGASAHLQIDGCSVAVRQDVARVVVDCLGVGCQSRLVGARSRRREVWWWVFGSFLISSRVCTISFYGALFFIFVNVHLQGDDTVIPVKLRCLVFWVELDGCLIGCNGFL